MTTKKVDPISKKEDVLLLKNKRIRSEKNKLNRVVKDLKVDEKTKKVIQKLIENAAFMAVTLEDLAVEINENGTTSEYKNGENQYGTKKSPEVEIYNTMIKNYTSVIKQINDCLPKSQQEEDDELKKFIMGG